MYRALVGAILEECKTHFPAEGKFEVFARTVREAALRKLRKGEKTSKRHIKKQVAKKVGMPTHHPGSETAKQRVMYIDPID